MTHPLQNKISGIRPLIRPRLLGKHYAAVTVVRKGKRLIVVNGSFSIAKPDTMIAEIPDDFDVIAPDKKEVVTQTYAFWMSTETFDPCHLILDWDGKE